MLISFVFLQYLYLKRKTFRIVLKERETMKKISLPVSLSTILCVLALAWLCVCSFRDSESQLCGERGCDGADVFVMS